VENWVKIPILIFIDQMLEGFGIDSLTNVIMEALVIGGGMPKIYIASKFISFGVDGVMYFKASSWVLQNRFEMTMFHIL
jgi:hypothetical protein